MDIEELFGTKKVKIAELGDWIAPVISLVSEPSVPWAYFVSMKSADGEGGSMGLPEGSRILKLLRENKGLSQAELAEIGGVAQNTVSTWETGRAGVPLKIAQKMAAPLGIDAKQLAFSTGLVALKARAEGSPESALQAAQAAYQMSQDETLTEQQRGLAAELCASLLATVENALGVTFDGEATEELPVAAKEYGSIDDRYEAAARDAEGRPLDPYRDLRIAGLMPPGENDRDEDRYRDLRIAGLLPPRTNTWRQGNVS